MSDIPEALGSAMEGAAFSRALEPQRGEAGAGGGNGHFHESICLNCGTALVGTYCHGCGQQGHLHRTVGAFLHDLLHGALHFEGKTFRTLPLLAWRPGQLTRRYIDGERARFVSPMAIFLFSVFLLFATFQVMGISPPANPGQIVTENGAAITADLGSIQERTDARVAELQARLDAMPPEEPARAATEEELAEVRDSSDFLNETGLLGMAPDDVETGWKRLDKGIAKARANPGLLLYKLQTNSYKFSWLLIPLSLPFMAMMFAWRRRFGLYDHAVFITYSISFMSLLFIALTVLSSFGLTSGWVTAIAATVPVWHIHRQLRGAYGLSRFSAVWRTVILIVSIGVVLFLFLAVLLLLGLVG